jgi:hypothetical protein
LGNTKLKIAGMKMQREENKEERKTKMLARKGEEAGRCGSLCAVLS